MMLTHEFRRSAGAGGGSRILPDVDQAEGVFSTVDDVTYTEEAPGGPIDWTGTISQAEYEANPTYFAQGTLVLLFDADDADMTYPDGRCIWGGEIDRPGVVENGLVKLHARGDGAKPYTVFGNRLWETRNEDRLAAADQEPHEYDQDEQIEARIVGRGIRLGWEKKTLFLRATGEAHLASVADKDDTSISLDVNGGGLSDGENIHIGGETKVVHNSYTPDSTSVPLSSGLGAKHKAGTHVYWRASGNPDEWASGALMWVPDRDVNSVQYDLHLTRHAAAILQLRVATGPDGASTLLDTVDCSTGALDRTVEVENIAGNPDLVYWRLVRRTQTDESGADRAFWAIVHDIRVRDLAGNTSTYSPAEVVLDIIDAEGGEVGNVPSSAANMMPLDGEGASDGAILDEAGMLTKRIWTRRRKLDGSGITWRFEAFGTRKTWLLTQARAPVVPQTLEQWNGVEVNFQRAGGLVGVLTEFADPDPFPGEQIVKHIELDDPPPEDIASAFALNAADMLAQEEKVARLEFSRLEDQADPGVEVPASRAHAGDVIIAGPDDYEYPVSKLQGTGDGVVVMDSTRLRLGETGRPSLDRIIKRRSLALARGASQAKATLGGFQLDIPATPVNVTMGIREIERRGGKRKFDAILDCDNVTEDINGKGTAIQRYVGIFEFQDENGDWVLDDDGERMQIFRHSERKRSGDGAVVPAVSRVIFKNLPHPHKWEIVGRMLLVDVFGEKSEVSAATDPIKPSAFGPDTPTDITLDIDQHWARAKWEDDDADELDEDGSASPNHKMARFKIRLLKAGVQVYPASGWKKMGRATQARIRVHKPGSATYTFEVKAADHYGNESGVGSATGSKVAPPTQTTAPTITFDRGGKKGIRAKVSVPAYGGTYTDDDITKLIVQFQAEDSNPVDGDPRDKRVVDIDPADLASAIVVPIGKIKAGEKVRARYRLKDTDENAAGWSNWSTTETASVSRKPNKVSGRSIVAKTRGLKCKWTPPTTWDDASSTGFSPSEIAYNVVTLRRAGADVETVRVGGGDTDFAYFPMTKAEAALTGYSFSVTAYGWDESFTTADAATGSATPEGIIAEGIDNGIVDYSKLASTLPGSAPPDSYDSPVSDGGSPPRYYLSTGPVGTWKTGDFTFNNSDLHTYRYESGAARWYRVADESFYANTIVGGTLSGIIIQGNIFRSVGPGSSTYIEIADSIADYIKWKSSGGTDLASLQFSGSVGTGTLNVGSTGKVELQTPGSSLILDSSTLNLVSATYYRDSVPLTDTFSGGSHSHTITSGGDHTHTVSAAGTTRKYGGSSENTAHWHELSLTDLGIVLTTTGAHAHGGSTSAATHSHS